MIAGQLEVLMLANLARLSDDMQKAKGIVGGAVKSIESMADTAKKALGAIGIGFSAHLILEKINSVAQGMSKLGTESEKTGVSVENLSKLQFFAEASGKNIESVNAALVTLSKGMSAANVESKSASQAFQFLGLSVKDAAGNLKDPSVLLGEIAHKLSEYRDGAGKAAISTALFRGAGAEMLPVLKKMAELGGVEATVTKEQAAAAEAYEIELIKLRRQKETLWNLVVGSMLPSMRTFVEVLIKSGDETGSLGSAIKTFSADKSFENWTDMAIMGLARLIDVIKTIPPLLKALGGSFETVWADIMVAGKFANLTNPLTHAGLRAAGRDPVEELRQEVEKRNKVLEAANRKYADLWNMPANEMEKATAKAIAARKANAQDAARDMEGSSRPGGTPGKPLNFAIADTKAIDAAAKAYREYIKERAKLELDEFRDVAQHKQQMLDMAYQDNRVSDEAYFRGKLEIAKATAEQEIAVIDDLRDAQLAAVMKAKSGTAEWWKALKDLEATEANRAKIIREFGQLAEVTFEQARKAAEAYRRSVEGINATLLEMRGRTRDAALSRFDISNKDILDKARTAGDTATVAKIAEWRNLVDLQAQMTEREREFNTILGEVAIKQNQIRLAVEAGSMSEIEALTRASEANRERLVQLKAIAAAYLEVAKASGLAQDILKAQQLQAEVERLTASTDLLAKSLNTTLADAMRAPFVEWILGTKKAKEAFNDFGNSVARKLGDLYIEALSKNIFKAMGMDTSTGGGGAGGWLAGIFKSMFGGGSYASGPAGAVDTSYMAVLGGYAEGTDYVPQTGPYLLHKGERVVPAAENGDWGGDVVMNISIDARGADSSVDLKIRAAMEEAKRAIVPIVLDAKRRNKFGQHIR